MGMSHRVYCIFKRLELVVRVEPLVGSAWLVVFAVPSFELSPAQPEQPSLAEAVEQ